MAKTSVESAGAADRRRGLFVGPTGGNHHLIPDEDSLGYQFRDTDLFRADRMQGYDLLDTGQRVDYGLEVDGCLQQERRAIIRILIRAKATAPKTRSLHCRRARQHADQRLSDVVGRVPCCRRENQYLYLILLYRLPPRQKRAA